MSCLIKYYLVREAMIKTVIGIILLGFLALPISAQNFPSQPDPPRLVFDATLTLAQYELDQLESKLVAYNDSTSTQIAIVIIRSTDGYPIDEYSFELAEKWGIGQSNRNNGILILIAKEDRKIWIATGYGVEGAVPDALAKRIVNQVIRPNFRADKYYEGLNEATDILIALLQGEYTADDLPKEKSGKSSWFPLLMILLFLFLIAFLKYRQVNRYSIINDVPFWTAWHILNAANAQQRGKWDDFRGGRGPFGGGGSSGGGGFGGFGGGSFGGGGAGGSW